MISTEHLESYTVNATDGVAGHVRDLYFDDEAWVVRYLVVHPGESRTQHQVLIPPIALGTPDPVTKSFPVLITRKQVLSGPDIDTHKPVSRQYEEGKLGRYEYPPYWGVHTLGDPPAYPCAMTPEPATLAAVMPSDEIKTLSARADAKSHVAAHSRDDPHLRSAKALLRYHVHAIDGNLGHVHALLIDEKTWALRYLVVDTSAWWIGHPALIAPEWIDDIDWATSKVVVSLSRDAIRSAPAYNSEIMPDRELEVRTYRHYGRDEYWPRGTKREAAGSGA